MTSRALMLQLLQEAGDRGVTTGELLQAGVGSRYGARLKELRSEGYEIASERVRDGSWRYTLSERVERDAGTPGPEIPTSGVAGMVSMPPVDVSLSLFETDGLVTRADYRDVDAA